MGKVCRVKQRTTRPRKRKGFIGHKVPDLVDISGENTATNENVNIVNTESNFCVNNESPCTSVNSLNSHDLSTLSSASSQKVQTFEAVTPTQSSKITGYRIVDTEILSDVIEMLLCPTCEEFTLSLCDNVLQKQGFSSSLMIKCSNCELITEFHTSKSAGRGYDVNKRMAYTMRVLGHGHSGLEKFAHLMNMPKPMTPNNYDKIIASASDIAKDVAEGSMSDVAEELRGSNDGVVDIGVTGDGTWQKRGFSSLNGVYAVLSTDNGKVLDVEPMSRSCKACFLKQDLMKTDPKSYAEWRNSHICKFNYVGSAGGMEIEGAKRVFERSITKHKLRYTKLLGDGDSKSFLSIKDTYPNVTVQKLECVGHYQKRVGTRLRKLKKTVKGLGGRGRLTDATVDRLQNFFGVAIRQNAGDLNGMKAATLASLFHVASSKNVNLHYPHCPTGSSSWCRYNADKANGTNLYKPGPGLPMDVILKVRPIFEDLSKESELEKCLHGKTQNSNESFNGTIWDRIPKTTYVSLTSLKLGVYDAVANFNIGFKATILMYEKMGMIPGQYTSSGCKRLNAKRLKLSDYKTDGGNKSRRQILRGKKLKKSDKLKEFEGKLYQAGGF